MMRRVFKRSGEQGVVWAVVGAHQRDLSGILWVPYDSLDDLEARGDSGAAGDQVDGVGAPLRNGSRKFSADMPSRTRTGAYCGSLTMHQYHYRYFLSKISS